MTKHSAITLGVILLVAIVAAGIAFTQINKTKTQLDQVAIASPTSTETSVLGQSKGTIKDLLGANKNISCEITYPEQQSSGTIFVSSPKFRGDFKVLAGSKEIISHMVQSDGYAYMWQDGMKQGTKFKIENLQNYSPAPSGQSQAMDLDKQVDMKCSDWSVDASRFEVPKEIKFTDISDLAKKVQSISTGSAATSGAPKIDKSVCDNISDESAKAACVRALEGK